MFLALELLLVCEFLAGGDDLVLRTDVRDLRSGRLGTGFRGCTAKPTADLTDLQAGRETLEITLLLVGEIDWEGVNLHGATKLLMPRARGREGIGLGGTSIGLVDPTDPHFARPDQLRCCERAL